MIMDLVRQGIDVAALHPMASVVGAAATILYLRLMLSGPRTY